jgi:hypothetical protein
MNEQHNYKHNLEKTRTVEVIEKGEYTSYYKSGEHYGQQHEHAQQSTLLCFAAPQLEHKTDD